MERRSLEVMTEICKNMKAVDEMTAEWLFIISHTVEPGEA